MAKVFLLLFGVLIFQQWSKAAANENSHPVINTSIEGDVTLNDEPDSAVKQIDSDSSQSQRKKRFYDYIGFGYPPYDYPTDPYTSQPHYSKRDDSQNTGVYGTEDALSHIFKRLHEVVRDVRQQNVPRRPQTPVPVYIPFLYIPQFDCGCTNNRQGPTPPVNNPTSNQRPTPPVNNPTSNQRPSNGNQATTQTSVTIEDRFPDLDDKRRNWGIVLNKTESNVIGNEGDGSRPINLDPVPPEEPFEVPVPPVDHGTVQAGDNSAQIPTQVTTNIPMQDVSGYPPAINIAPELDTASKDVVLSACDGAILKCCTQSPITDKCFATEGCKNPYIYGSPCDPKVYSTVVTKFLQFQKQISG